MSRQGGSGRSRFNMTHTPERGAAARKSQRVTRVAGVEKFVVSRFTPTCIIHVPPGPLRGVDRGLGTIWTHTTPRITPSQVTVVTQMSHCDPEYGL